MSVAALALLRRCWWAIPILLLGAALLLTRAQLADTRRTLTNERAAWSAEVDRADRARAEQERGFAQQLATATSTYADRLAAREPIILHSTNTVREYAQTAAGRVMCRDAERVRAIDALDAALDGQDPAATRSGADAVRADAAAPAAGR